MVNSTQQRMRALVTGASAGIGREYAFQLALERGYDLILVARRTDRLETVKGEIEVIARKQGRPVPQVLVLTADLREQAERERVISQVSSLGLEIDLLVNNAGYGSLGGFSRSDLAWESNMALLNCVAPLHFCREFLPSMRARKQGAVINVCSTIAFQPFPYMATYGATKAFLLSFSVALAEEVKADNVRVLAHCPGPTESEFHLVAGLGEKLSYLPAMTARKAVWQALQALERGKIIVVNGFVNWLLSRVSLLVGPVHASRLVRAVMKKHE